MSKDLWPLLEAHLQKYGLKASGRSTTRFACNSPLRSSSDSGAFHLMIKPDALGGGVYIDRVTEDGGSFYDLAIKLDLIEDKTYAQRPAGGPTLTTYDSLEAYEQAQIGEDAGAFARARWEYGSAYCGTHSRERPALLFPTLTGQRWRYTDGLKPKYGQQKGYTGSWYGMPKARRILADEAQAGQTLVLCNGEASVITAQHYGVPAICLTGGGERGIPDALLDELFTLLGDANQTFFLIALDCDDTGRRAAQKILKQLQQVRDDEREGIGARAVDLQGAKGFDLANFAKLHRQETSIALLSLPDAPVPAEKVTEAEYKDTIARLESTVEEWKAVAMRQQELLAEKDAELQAVKDMNRWTATVNSSVENIENATQRDTMIALRKQLDYDPEEAAKHDGYVHVIVSRVAEDAGCSAPTASRNIKKFAANNLIECKTEKIFDEAAGHPRTMVWIRPLVDLADPNVLVVKSGHGGKREPKKCIECGSVHLVMKHQKICNACGTPQAEATLTLVNTEEDVKAELDAGGPEPLWLTGDDVTEQDEQHLIDETAEAGEQALMAPLRPRNGWRHDPKPGVIRAVPKEGYTSVRAS